jgi:hypothetical protein
MCLYGIKLPWPVMSAAITRWSNSSQLPRRAAITSTWQSGTPYCTHLRWRQVLGWVTTKEDRPLIRFVRQNDDYGASTNDYHIIIISSASLCLINFHYRIWCFTDITAKLFSAISWHLTSGFNVVIHDSPVLFNVSPDESNALSKSPRIICMHSLVIGLTV